MPRRWIIRTLFLFPILLCLAGWLWSSTHLTGVGYHSRIQGVYLETAAGTLWFEWGLGFVGSGWESINRPLDPPEFWPSRQAWNSRSVLGFSYGYEDPAPGQYRRDFAIPYWFLIVVCGGVFAWVWRKTRRKPDPKTAFPVEVAAAGGTKDEG